MGWCIRKASAADYEALRSLFEEGDALHREHLPHIFQRPQGPARGRDYVLGLIADPDVGLFVAQAEGQLVGLICVLVREAPAVPILVPRRYAVVDNLVVSEGFRREGIGRALMERAQAWAVAQGVEAIELNVWEFNRGAMAFYWQLGYQTASRKMSKKPENE